MKKLPANPMQITVKVPIPAETIAKEASMRCSASSDLATNSMEPSSLAIAIARHSISPPDPGRESTVWA